MSCSTCGLDFDGQPLPLPPSIPAPTKSNIDHLSLSPQPPLPSGYFNFHVRLADWEKLKRVVQATLRELRIIRVKHKKIVQISKIFHQIEYYDRLILLSKEKFAGNLMQNWFSLSLHKTQNDEPSERHWRLPGDVIELHKISIINIHGEREKEGGVIDFNFGELSVQTVEVQNVVSGSWLRREKNLFHFKILFHIAEFGVHCCCRCFCLFSVLPLRYVWTREHSSAFFHFKAHTKHYANDILHLEHFHSDKKGEDEMLLQLWLGRINFQI